MHPKVKICGMTDAKTIQTAIDHKVDYLGFVFYPKSPRNLSPKQATALIKNIPNHISKVAVLVDETDQFLEYIKNDFDFFQLHGNEDVKRIKEIKQKYNKKIIKVIKVTDEKSANTYQQFTNEVDMFLFDSPAMEKTASFDWQILSKLKITKPYLVAGSININNVDAVLKYNPFGIDISAGVESSIGVKSNKKIIEFLEKVKS
ncbi:MAG: phosphoribosylanthranilate isomerase [Candidatus Fonsibacter sp.]|nr:phosphoribosylanthranilate isomerase [Candidatus Fonsibacter sp.]